MREQQEAKERVSEGAVRENMDWLYSNDKHPTAGNPDGDVTVVEFFDYNCGYCKRALSDIMTIIGEDPNVRVVFIELPILGPGSTEAAKWAKASMAQGRYLEYHVALMEHRGRLNEAQLEMIAKKVGLDVDKLKEDKEADYVANQLDENIAMARTLGITGTPAFVIGEDLARGYVGLEALKQGIAQKRLTDAALEGDSEE
jgi:protein-disulfide isomerase